MMKKLAGMLAADMGAGVRSGGHDLERRYQTLDEDVIIRTIALLGQRVGERFPARGLAQTALYLLELARKSVREARQLRQPSWLARALVLAALAIGAYGLYLFRGLVPDLKGGAMSPTELAQGLDASFNIIILVGLAVAFLIGLEARFKRRRALGGLYRLRAIAHVIDMHQLTKDPPSILGDDRTPNSPTRDLTHGQLLRYLDYCSEMLSMTAKLAALYVQHFPDAVVISSVNDVEVLTTNLSRKIWQKIIIVQGEPQD
jgi:hypothetical protein